MDEQAVEGVADAHPACLGIIDDPTAFLQVAVFVEVGMNNACSCLYDRHTGIAADEVDELPSSTGNAEVNIADSTKQFCRCLMRRRHQSHHICG